jgi:hypothetical protein
MNREELKKELDELGIPPFSYSLHGGDAILIPIIGRKHGKWFIYEFDERGNHYQQYSCDKEEDICEFFYQKIVKENKFRKGNCPPESANKAVTYKITKKGDFIGFEDGIPKWKNGVEVCPNNPIFLNGKPILFDDEDVFDDREFSIPAVAYKNVKPPNEDFLPASG